MVFILVPRPSQPVYIKPRDAFPMADAMTVSDIHHSFATGFKESCLLVEFFSITHTQYDGGYLTDTWYRS